MEYKPNLFGIINSNRDFTNKDSWGKNQFNSSFPAALSAYLFSKGLKNIYITLDSKLRIAHSMISTEELYGISPTNENIFYAFEAMFAPFQRYIIGSLPRVDLVIQNKDTGTCLRGMEVKLTALPDNSTCNLEENKYGSEIVIRPDTIVYLACSIAENFKHDFSLLKSFFPKKIDEITDWSEAENVIPCIGEMISTIDKISAYIQQAQKPIVIQPIWKTESKSPRLATNCLDVFVWSDLSFMQLFLNAGRNIDKIPKITRQIRTIIWLTKMLYELATTGQFNHYRILDELSYNTKNDKAFAVNGSITNPYMRSEALLTPRITKYEIKNIIVGGGQNLLSPERRFDAIIYNSLELF